MSLEHAILGFLAEQPHSGYDLKTRCFDQQLSHAWTADQAQVYRTLDDLLKRGLARARRIRQSGRPDRKVFSITAAGTQALQTWLLSPPEAMPLRDPFLVRLRFAASLTDAEILDLLGAARDSHQKRLEGLRSRPSGAPDQDFPANRRRKAVELLGREGAVAVERATIDWLDDCLDRVGQGLPAATDQIPSAT